jgi:uncharacterized coiled-coil DUF342 family protein
MVDEKFLQSAIRIRRTYLNLTSDLNFYKSSLESKLKNIQESYQRIDDLINSLKKQHNQNDDEVKQVKTIMKQLNKLDKIADELNSDVNPINEQIESLAKEEQELYNRIREKHQELSEAEIVECVRERLIKEGLS